MTSWSQLTTSDEASRRAAGRRNYNFQRKLRAQQRQIEVVKLVAKYGLFDEEGKEHGIRTRIAKELGVSRSTISRDIKDTIYLHHDPVPAPPTTSTAKWIRTLEPFGEQLATQGCVCEDQEEPQHRLGHVLKFVVETLDGVAEGKVEMPEGGEELLRRVRDVLVGLL